MSWNEKYRQIIERMKDPEYLQKKMAELAENAQKGKCKYYLIQQENTKVGIYGYINCFLPHIAYAIENGMIPVIDMATYDNIYIPAEKKGSGFNSWESFFEQPFHTQFSELNDKNTVNCPADLWYRWMPSSFPLMSDQDISLWSALFKEYIRYSEKSAQYIKNEEAEILEDPENTIGVIYRGTTYTKGHATGHPIQPTMKMLADKVEDMMTRNNASCIYLASDEESIVKYMNSRFPGKVKINKRVYYDNTDADYSKYNIDGTDIVGNMFDRENNEYLIGIEYISSMNLVSKCGYFVGGACGGTTAVLYLNGLKFKERYVFDLGRYGTDPIPQDESC